MLLTTDTMVLICDVLSPKNNITLLEKIAVLFSDFQNGQSKALSMEIMFSLQLTLVQVNFPAEFMIEHFTRNADEEGRPRKKVICASQLKRCLIKNCMICEINTLIYLLVY